MADSGITPTLQEMEAGLGDRLRAQRLSSNLDQKTLAERAGVSLRALRNLEGGQGSTVKTLVSVLRALGRQDWLQAIAPMATINPLMLTPQAQPRQRASRPRQHCPVQIPVKS
jgi:transcriptional regulator with XRE-family HTH domain